MYRVGSRARFSVVIAAIKVVVKLAARQQHRRGVEKKIENKTKLLNEACSNSSQPSSYLTCKYWQC